MRGAALRPTHRWVAAVLGGWLAVRLVQWLSGATYSDRHLDFGWQLVPRETLRHDYLGSLWYLHVQPPLYNAVIGLLLRVPFVSDAVATRAFILACSLAAAFGLYRLALVLGLPPVASVIFATVVLADPFMIRYELEPTYEIPVLAALVWGLVLLAGLARRPTQRRFVAFVAVLTAVVMTRSLLHPLWLLGVAGIAWWMLRTTIKWRTVALSMIVPLVAIGGWSLKNWAVFGEPTLSSWFGMNLQRGVIAPMDRGAIDPLVAAGDLPAVVSVPSFVSYSEYEPFMPPCVPDHDRAAVANPLRPNGLADFNYECFLPVYRAMSDAARTAITHRPLEYIRSRGPAIAISFDHLTDSGYHGAVQRAAERVFKPLHLDIGMNASFANAYQPLFGAPYVRLSISVVTVMATIGTAAIGIAAIWSARRPIVRPAQLARAALEAVIGFSVVWVLAVGILTETGENARFRAMVHPLLLLVPLAAVFRRLRPEPASAEDGPQQESEHEQHAADHEHDVA
jgi:hypothetical protein